MTPLSDQTRPALAPGVRLQTDAVSGEPILLFPEGVLFLNPTAHEIVSRCDGVFTMGAIVTALAGEYDADPAALRQDVLECLHDLHQRKLITLSK